MIGIVNACKILTGQTSPLPNVAGTLRGWLRPMTFRRLFKGRENFDVVENYVSIVSAGMKQLFSSQQLALKPEGQRAWKWWMVHTATDVQLAPDDVVQIDGIEYRVMEKLDYADAGYLQYNVVEDYTG